MTYDQVKKIALLILICWFTLILSIPLIFILKDYSDYIESNRLKNQCREYELIGTIKNGNCACAEKIFPNFSHSYDWMDACAILEARNIK